MDDGQRTKDESKIAIRFRNFYNGEMPVSQAKLFFVFLSAILLLNACSGNEAANVNSVSPNSNSNAAAIVPLDDVEELGKIVKLSYAPQEATFYEFDLSADANSRPSVANAKRLVAVLQFSAENANRLAADAAKNVAPAPLDVDAENWFPPELIAKSQETGDGSLKGVSYPAADFVQPPYINGRLTRINDTNYYVLEMLTF